MADNRKARPYWPSISYEAAWVRPNLVRALAQMNFSAHVGILHRGDLPEWRPSYSMVPGGALPAFREMVAANNRAMRDSDVHMLVTAEIPKRMIFVDEYQGNCAWRSRDGANAGDDLISLGMWRWRLDFAPAAYRIARIINLEIPRVKS